MSATVPELIGQIMQPRRGIHAPPTQSARAIPGAPPEGVGALIGRIINPGAAPRR